MIDLIKLPNYFEETSRTIVKRQHDYESDGVYVEGKQGEFQITLTYTSSQDHRWYRVRMEVKNIDSKCIYSSNIDLLNNNVRSALDEYRKTEGGLLSIQDLLTKIECRDYVAGMSGTFRKYRLKPCVVSYAIQGQFCTAILKFIRTYSAVHIYGGRGGNKIYSIELKKAIDEIKMIQDAKPEVLELTEEDKRNIIAKMI